MEMLNRSEIRYMYCQYRLYIVYYALQLILYTQYDVMLFLLQGYLEFLLDKEMKYGPVFG